MNNMYNHDDDLFEEEKRADEHLEMVGKGIIEGLSLKQLVFAIIAFVLGILIILFTMVGVIHLMSYNQTTATIVDIEYDEERDMYTPIYEFIVNNQTVRAEGISTSDSRYITVGTTQKIAYNPKNYKQFDVGTTKESLIFFLVGVILLAYSIIYAYKNIKIMKIAFKMGQDAQG